jgi:predicted flap endonuclease-1-like 5' DNA nuclease
MDEMIKQVSHKSSIQPFAANQKKKKRKSIMVSFFSLVNRLVMMTMLILLMRWWLQRQNEQGMPEQTSREKEITLDEYGGISEMEQSRTAPDQPPAVSGYKPQAEPAQDNLRLIEGIGPKISGLLQSAGIHTFQQLADMEPNRIQAILHESGMRQADPETWPEQARYLVDGDLEGLRQLQAQLKAGRRS